MIGKVIEGRYAGSEIHKLPDKNVLFIQTDEGERIALSKKNVASMDDVTEQYPNYGKKVMMVLWNDFETSIIQFGVPATTQDRTTRNTSSITNYKARTEKSQMRKSAKNKSNSKLLIGGVFAVIILAVLVVILLIPRSGSNENSNENKTTTTTALETESSATDVVKANAMEYVQNTISGVIDQSYYGDLRKSDILDSITVTYEKEEIDGDNFEIIAIYRCTLGKEYLHIKFEITGTLGAESFNMNQIESYTSEAAPEDQLTAPKISISEKKKIAETEAISEIISYLKSTPGYTTYDVNASKYKVGTITQGSGTAENHFTVNGTLYLYDKYGSLSDTSTFSVTVVVRDDGSYNALRPRVDK